MTYLKKKIKSLLCKVKLCAKSWCFNMHHTIDVLNSPAIKSLYHWPLGCWLEIPHVPCLCRIIYVINNSNKDDNDYDIYFLKFPDRTYNFVNMLLMNWRHNVILIPWLIHVFSLVKFVEPKSWNIRLRFYTEEKENYEIGQLSNQLMFS